LDGEHCLVGRAQDCDVAIPDQRVSRHHARLTRTPTGLGLEDLGSANGTFLNQRRLNGSVGLHHGDEITIGTAHFRVDFSDERDEAIEGRITIVDGPSGRPVVEVANIPRRPSGADIDSQRVSREPGAEASRLADKLQTIYRVSAAVASALEPRALLNLVVEQLLDVFSQASECAAVLIEARSGRAGTVVVRRRNDSSGDHHTVLSSAVIDRVLHQGHSVLLRSAGEGSSVADGCATGTRMGAPLLFGDEAMGILHVEASVGGELFRQADLDLLGGIAAQIGVALQLARVHERLLHRDRIEKDLAIARQIQRSLLPRHPPALRGIDIAVHYEPAFQVGGDFFDFLRVDATHLAIVIGDVSGKAISGALFMARVASEIRAQVACGREPDRLLRRVNRAIADACDDGVFCTALVLCIDLETHVARLANAGHVLPLLRRDGRVIAIDPPHARSQPLGIEREVELLSAEVRLEPGDVLLFHTDGLTEARNGDGELFGAERVAASLEAASSRPEDVVGSVLRDVDRFVGEGPQVDDQTMVCVAVEAHGSQMIDTTSQWPVAQQG
jgi:serine phosphatase RsbU (regulator of sigma subunit)